jgi:hypothetical protein
MFPGQQSLGDSPWRRSARTPTTERADRPGRATTPAARRAGAAPSGRDILEYIIQPRAAVAGGGGAPLYIYIYVCVRARARVRVCISRGGLKIEAQAPRAVVGFRQRHPRCRPSAAPRVAAWRPRSRPRALACWTCLGYMRIATCRAVCTRQTVSAPAIVLHVAILAAAVHRHVAEEEAASNAFSPELRTGEQNSISQMHFANG